VPTCYRVLVSVKVMSAVATLFPINMFSDEAGVVVLTLCSTRSAQKGIEGLVCSYGWEQIFGFCFVITGCTISDGLGHR
jgi:hypothetical protein